jgi:hypothetical protein
MALTKPSNGILDVVLPSYLRNVYDTKAQAAAASPDTNVLGFITLGYSSVGDGGGALYAYDASPETTEYITCSNGRIYELEMDKANIKQFGAISNSTVSGVMSGNSTALQNAINYAKIKGVPVYIPTGNFYLSSGVTIDFAIKMEGDGDGSRLFYREGTSTLLTINLGAAGVINYAQFRNFAVYLSITIGVTAQTGKAFEVTGTGDCYFQWALFENINSYGFDMFFVSNASSHVTTFGNEGPVNWCRFNNIKFDGASGYHNYGFVFNTGSGTGNEFHGCRGYIHNWVWLYQGAGGTGRVVGDIVIIGGHFGSYNTTTSRIFVCGDNMQYRSRLRIQGMQADAGVAAILQLSTVGGGWSEVIVDVTRGGATTMGNYPTLSSSSLGFSRGTVAAA